MVMRKVYVAGPFRGSDSWVVERNIREAEVLGFQVAAFGALPVIPHTMFRFFNGTLLDQFWLDATTELLRVCDAVVLTARWRDSSGAIGEEREARRLKLPVFEAPGALEDLAEWIRKGR